jgi:uncharacterized protein YkwD
MAFSARSTLRLMALPLVAGALLLVPGLSAQASGASACHRYGDAKPGSISGKHAEAAIFCFINRKRHDHGKASLSRKTPLGEAADRHNQFMINHNCFSHQCSGEGSLDTRLKSTGYLAGGLIRWMYGENIAWGEEGKGTPASIVNAWMHSAGHRANILNGTFKDVGIGVDWGTPYSKSYNGGTYTLDFGYRLFG